MQLRVVCSTRLLSQFLTILEEHLGADMVPYVSKHAEGGLLHFLALLQRGSNVADLQGTRV